jgi:hypothetical protein
VPHLTFAASLDGLGLEVMMGLNGQETASLAKSGQPIPRPIPARALVDTATDVTALAPRLLTHFGCVPVYSVPTLTAAGSIRVQVYAVSLTITAQSILNAPMLVRETLHVTELAVPLPDCEVLLGQDVLAQCLLISDGPGKQFTLAF